MARLPYGRWSIDPPVDAASIAQSDVLATLIGVASANRVVTFADAVIAGLGFIANAVVKTVHLVDEAVTTGKIADGAVTADKLASNSVTGGKIANGAVTHAKLGSDIVDATRTALGRNAEATDTYSVALGRDAQATEISSTALGTGARANGIFSVALGAGARASDNYSVALGQNVISTNAFPLTIRAGDFRLRYNTGNGKLEASKDNGVTWQTVNVSGW